MGEVEDLQPVGIGDILEFSFRVYRQRFGTLARAAAVVVVPIWILTLVVLAASPPAPAIQPLDLLTEVVDIYEVALAWGTLLLVGGLGALAHQLATAASFMVVVGAYLGVSPSWQQSLAFAWRRLGPLVWLQFVYSALIVVGLAALVIPGIYLTVAWAVAVPVLLFEDLRGFDALRRSRELLRGRWWPTAGLLALVAIGTGLFQNLLEIPFRLLVADSGSDYARSFVETAAGLTGAVVTTPFMAAVLTVLFFDALVRKEDFTVSDMAMRVGIEPPDAPAQWVD